MIINATIRKKTSIEINKALNKIKIIVFKSDTVGDLIHFSPILKIIKDNIKNSNITLVCSQYNYQIAKNYKFVDKYIIFDKGNILKTILSNFGLFFLTKYKYLFQFDGKNNSYLISYFMRADSKSTICFIKHKKILSYNYRISRPGKILLNLFYNNFVVCDEKYDDNTHNKFPVHYQSLFFNVLEKLKFELTTKKNIFYLNDDYTSTYEAFFKNNINQRFFLFHIDERWDRFSQIDYENTLKLITKISQKNKIVITTGIKKFLFLNTLEKKFSTYNFLNDEFISIYRNNNSKQIILLKNMPLDLLAYFIKNADKNISAHTGLVVHMSAAFGKEIIDIIKKEKNDELDRWIPLVSNYKRINFDKIDNNYLKNLKI